MPGYSYTSTNTSSPPLTGSVRTAWAPCTREQPRWFGRQHLFFGHVRAPRRPPFGALRSLKHVVVGLIGRVGRPAQIHLPRAAFPQVTRANIRPGLCVGLTGQRF